MLGDPVTARPMPVHDALLDGFERTLASSDSATDALAQWCRKRGLAADPAIRAIVLRDPAPAEPRGLRALLDVGPREALGYRHVRLMCGDRVLSHARNWYVPVRLRPAMVSDLAMSDRPFGAVIAPLRFSRERLSSHRGGGPGCPPDTILTNRALIRDRDGAVLAFVVECYDRSALAHGG